MRLALVLVEVLLQDKDPCVSVFLKAQTTFGSQKKRPIYKTMFEIPDDDELDLWDDFTLTEEDIISSHTSLENNNQVCQSGIRHDAGRDVTSILRPTCKDGNLKKENLKPTPAASGPAVSRRSERKFPGPAGLLPIVPADGNNSTPEFLGVTHASSSKFPDTDERCLIPASQSQPEEVGSLPHWRRMVEDLGDDAAALLNKFSIKSLLTRASRKMLHKGKAPLVFGVLEKMALQGSEASFLIRDETSKMKGSLHKDLIQDPNVALQSGCVLMLRQVSVISLSDRAHYLNVTPSNVVFIYSSNQESEIDRRSWPSPMSPHDSVSRSADSGGSPSLRQIIEVSEREFSASIENFKNKASRSSIQLPKSSGIRGMSQMPDRPPSLFSLNSPQAPALGPGTRLQRPSGHPCRAPRGQQQTTPPFTSPGFRGYNPGLRLQSHSHNHSESPWPAHTKSASNFRQPLPMTSARGGNLTSETHPQARAGMISGDVVVRKPKTGGSSHPRSSLNPPIFPEAIKCYDSNASASLDEFPEDNADGELLQFCDDTLSQMEDDSCGEIGKFEERNPQPQLKLDFHPERANSHERVTNPVMSKVFNECEQEHGEQNFHLKKPETLSHEAQPSLAANIHVKSNSGKTFSFKRSSALSPTLPELSFNSPKRQCLNEQLGQSGALKGLTKQQRILNDTKASIVERQGAVQNKDSERQRDSRIQLGQRNYSAPAPVSIHTDTAALWDDDLTDDLLLSQLSEEF